MAYTTIDKPTDYFNTKLHTGTSAEQSITGVGFQPDFVWIKGRSNAYDHRLVDSVRGATKELYSDLTNAEATDTQGLKSFNSDGFTLGTANAVNNSGLTYVSWNWLAGGTASSNTDGSITSSVSANTTSGFSIVSYTGTGANATVGHGLGVAPAMIIIKNRDDGTRNWGVYHKSLGSGNAIRLNQTSASFSTTNFWNSTEPTSTVWSMGNQFDVNDSGDNNIAYCFAEKKGFSKFGSYTGNGNADGTFVYTGFKPAFVITKRTDGIVDWYMFDNKRQNPFNVVNGMLRPSASSTELDDSSVYVDFLSNGFKWRGSNAGNNASGGTYIYMAIAEQPLVASNNVCATAR